jgi:branched-chain amino acid aminotransferase
MSHLSPTERIWRNGAFIPWDEARIHVLSHVVSYGSAVFEGMRCYDAPAGPALFRAPEHMRRLVDSARIYRMELPYTAVQLCEAACELVRVNGLKACYVRPIVLRGYGAMGVSPSENPIDVYMACWEWGAYLGEAALAEGVDVCVSSWRRMAPNTLPALSKSAANYMNSQLIKMEALANGYQEGIALDAAGAVSEGSGENIFVVRDGKLLTPPLGGSVLEGVTRNTVIQLAHDLGIPVVETSIPREMLYIADEVFFTGTAAEITPIRSIDRIRIGEGRRGPVTQKLQAELFAILKGARPDRHGWLTPVGERSLAAVAASLPCMVRVP